MFLLQCMGFPGGSVVKNLPANAEDSGDMGLSSRSERFPGGGNGNPLQYSCLENPMDRGTSWLQFMGLQKVSHDQMTEHTLQHKTQTQGTTQIKLLSN